MEFTCRPTDRHVQPVGFVPEPGRFSADCSRSVAVRALSCASITGYILLCQLDAMALKMCLVPQAAGRNV
jgi:hypothetical protein